MRKALSFALAILTMSCSMSFADDVNYCHDPATEAEWIALLAKNPKDHDLQALHALRIGLCVKVDQGILTVAEATKIFERARSVLLEKKVAEEKLEAMDSKTKL